MSLLRKALLRRSHSIVIACSLGCLSCGDCVETPSISSITPTSAVAGRPELVLVVNGNHLQRNSAVNWNDEVRPTTFVNSHQLTTVVSAADLASAVFATVTVFSPPQSQPVMFGSSTSSSSGASSSTMPSMKVDCAGGISRVVNFEVSP
jgi:hypothetical protein